MRVEVKAIIIIILVISTILMFTEFECDGAGILLACVSAFATILMFLSPSCENMQSRQSVGGMSIDETRIKTLIQTLNDIDDEITDPHLQKFLMNLAIVIKFPFQYEGSVKHFVSNKEGINNLKRIMKETIDFKENVSHYYMPDEGDDEDTKKEKDKLREAESNLNLINAIVNNMKSLNLISKDILHLLITALFIELCEIDYDFNKIESSDEVQSLIADCSAYIPMLTEADAIMEYTYQQEQ